MRAIFKNLRHSSLEVREYLDICSDLSYYDSDFILLEDDENVYIEETIFEPNEKGVFIWKLSKFDKTTFIQFQSNYLLEIYYESMKLRDYFYVHSNISYRKVKDKDLAKQQKWSSVLTNISKGFIW